MINAGSQTLLAYVKSWTQIALIAQINLTRRKDTKNGRIATKRHKKRRDRIPVLNASTIRQKNHESQYELRESEAEKAGGLDGRKIAEEIHVGDAVAARDVGPGGRLGDIGVGLEDEA